MKLLSTLLALITTSLLSNSVMAKWIYISEAPGVKFYIDIDTLKINGDIAKVQLLNDYKEIHLGARSERESHEINCKKNLSKPLGFTRFEENMGDGVSYDSEENIGDWKDVPPNTIGFLILEYTCGKKDFGEVVTSDSSLNNWTFFHEDSEYKQFADFSSLSIIPKEKSENKKTELRKVWIMLDAIKPTSVLNVIHLSSKLQLEINCKEKHARYVQTALFSDHMGKGNILLHSISTPASTPKWIEYGPENALYIHNEKFCAGNE